MRLPRTIAGYTFVELLGVGSFGSVYRATITGDLGFTQEVAIKVLDATHAAVDPGNVAALANEARILSHVQHPNIVQARHFKRVDDEAIGDSWILVLELVRGQSLRRLLRWDRAATQPLSIKAPLQLMSELCDGLHFAHKLLGDDGQPQGLVHRDLKPANIHITNEGRVKILDFGIAWAKHRLGSATDGGMTKGTPLYMSPEQLRGERLDGRSDLYAMGAIVFEFLTGQPYVRMDASRGLAPLARALSVTFAQREPDLRRALTTRYDLDPGASSTERLVSLLADLLAHDPDARPNEGGVVFDRLEALPELHRPSQGRGELRRWVERRHELDAEAAARGVPPDDQDADAPHAGKVSQTILLERPAESIESLGSIERVPGEGTTPPALPPDPPPEDDGPRFRWPKLW